MGARTRQGVKSNHVCGPRVRSGVALLGLVTAVLLPSEARAQEPPPRPDIPADTAAVDTAAVPDSRDLSVQDGAAADTLEPVDVVPRLPGGPTPSWRGGVWEWDRDAIQASGAITLTDLLERIPGVQPVRYGLFGQSEAVSVWGLAGGGMEVVLDGFVLDPLDAGIHDLSRIELVHLDRVRVERSAGRLRVELETVAPIDHRAYSIIEAGMGQPDDSKMIRGLFQTPRFLGGPFSVAIDRVDSDGFRRAEPANAFAGWLKWGRVSENSALQLEVRQNDVERTLPDGTVVDGARRDWVVRARGAPAVGLTTEVYLGASSIDENLVPRAPAGDDGDEGEDATVRMTVQSVQAGANAAYRSDRGWGRAAVRLRNDENLPLVETELAGGVNPFGPLHLSGSVGWADWRRGVAGGTYGAKIEVGPIFGFRPFAEVSGGRRGVPFLRDATGRAVLTERTSFRAGGDFEWKGLHLGGAFVGLSADSVATFGLPFDYGAGLFSGGELRGWEVVGRVPLLWEPLSLEGSYVRWNGASRWIYTPQESWRAALVYSHSPLESGNLEVLARLEGRHQGAMAVPTSDGALVGVAPYTAYDFYLQLRILDVRIFVRWENLLRSLDIQYLPERAFPSQRVFYGVKWHFWN